MADMEIEVQNIESAPDAVLIRIKGELDTLSLPKLRTVLESVKGQHKKRIALDLEGVSYANSTSLGTMVKEGDDLRNAGGELIIVKPQPKVELVMDMLGLSQFFKIFKNDQDVLQYVGGGALQVTSKPASGPTPTPVPPPSQAPQPATAVIPAGPYPVYWHCTYCRVSVHITEAGEYICPRCHQPFQALSDGTVLERPCPNVSPAEVAIDLSGPSIRAFDKFVTDYLQEHGVPPATAGQLVKAIKEIRSVFLGIGYDGDTKKVLAALLLVRNGEVLVKLSHTGKVITNEQAANVLDPLKRDLDTVAFAPHPISGNVVKLTKKFQPSSG